MASIWFDFGICFEITVFTSKFIWLGAQLFGEIGSPDVVGLAVEGLIVVTPIVGLNVGSVVGSDDGLTVFSLTTIFPSQHSRRILTLETDWMEE